ncbi:phenylalanine--tRNA ligase beta subunit [Striga asiatica]|uniref:phenylalanine--tRNA ligase n=1 Tax=Striga asiatica TaxID=4170 RepID=A0A5A7P3D3_STRAF|nr:phenylalanine--tRNA ligase beta subunit [Striga asiatica]
MSVKAHNLKWTHRGVGDQTFIAAGKTMPTVSLGRDRLFEALGRTYTEEEFEDLCFKFGIELDDVTTEKAIIRKEKHLEEEEPSDDEEVIYKIEVPANRYDLLCLEGLAQALRIFNGLDTIPRYTLASISKESMLKMHVKPETSRIRPYVVCAVLRGVTFDEARYNSFIDLQDRLHQNICRRRTLVAIGTHDLDTIEGPFTYEALSPQEISFVPLKQAKSFRADELMEFYKSDLKLKKFLHIIENSPVFPIIYDSKRTVLSLPPIINGAHSAISLKTKNVFIECTATDLTKANIVLNTVVTMFSIYCERKFEVEPVEVIYPDGKSVICPDLSLYQMVVPLSYITSAVGVSLPAQEVASLLNKMQLHAKQFLSEKNETSFTVSVPPTRSDILHPCDVAEDVAIAYGYNEIQKIKLPSLKPQSLNQFSDLIRAEIAMVGYTEVLTWILCSYKENFTMLNRNDDKSTAAINGNPRSADFEVVRTSLMPGILKTVSQNKDHPKPIKIFEVGDVVLLDETKDVGASNRRHLAALYCGATSGFELIHGLVDRIMEVTGTPFVSPGDNTGYYIQLSKEPEFLPGRQASILYKGKQIGTFGIVHPQVLQKFEIPDPCSFVEMNIESFL